MIYLGIDPGKAGALAYIMGETVSVFSFDENVYNAALGSAALMQENGEHVFCCLEHVGAMPGQGVTSMFSFGENFGFIRGLLHAHCISYELVRPQKWKREFSITGDKNTSIAVCKRLFPDVPLRRTERCRKDDDGLAEAVLLAEYARRKMQRAQF